MSYGKFLDESDKLFEWREKNDLPKQHYEKTFADLRDIWIKDRRYSELTAFINENWDSGNGDDFVKPYSEHLTQNGKLSQFKKLWKGILRHRISSLWTYYDHLKKSNRNITLEEIKSQKLGDFNQFSTEESMIRRVSWKREYVLKGIEEFNKGLKKLNDNSEFEKNQRLYNDIDFLIKSKPKPSSDKRKIDETLFWELINNYRTISDDNVALPFLGHR